MGYVSMDGTKLAGPAAGGYGGGQKMSSHKRKRDKAQEQLRSRMRHRMNGNGNSSAILHAKRRSALLDGRGDTSLSAGLKHSSSVEVTSRDLQGTNYWRPQQERYNKLTQLAAESSARQPRVGSNKSVPLQMQELVDRVLHRQEQSLGLDSKVSPMTIRAYKPPVAPYAIQQSSHVKKIVKMKPIQREDGDDKGPFVLVLQRNGSDDAAGTSQPRGRRRYRTRSSTDHDNSAPMDSIPSVGSSTRVLPPVSSSKSPGGVAEPNTWRPALGQIHKPEVLPEAEDRSVTNYRLQLQHANKLAEARGFEYNHMVPVSGQTVEEMTMQSLNPLPPIQSVYHGDGSEDTASGRHPIGNDGEMGADNYSSTENQQSASHSSNNGTVGSDRAISNSEILNLKKAQKEAKRQKQVQAEELTLLRTRKRYTNKTKQFKSDLERARQLSAIQEDRSSLNSARLSGRSSGRRQSLSSSSSASGSNSLKSIDETVAANSSCETSGTDKGQHRTIPLAPPTTPSTPLVEHVDHGVIMNVNVMNSSMDDMSSDEEEDNMMSGSNLNASTSSTSSSSSSSSEESVDVEPMQSGDIPEGMTWGDGEIPFREHKPTSEHGR